MKALISTAVACALLAPSATDFSSTHRASEVRRTSFSFTESSALVEMNMMQNGEELPDMMEMEQEKSTTRGGSFVDTTVRVEGDRRTIFEREYLGLEQTSGFSFRSPMGDDQSNSVDLSSSLNDHRVRFELEDDEFRASFAEDTEGEDEWLDGLDAELPWPQFLPASEVEVGDQWELESRSFMQALELGGNLVFSEGTGNDAAAAMLGTPSTDEELTEYDGVITARLTALEELDGVAHAVITLEVEFSSFQDKTELMAAMQANGAEDAPEGMVMPDIQAMEAERTYSGEGTLTWNLEAGCLRSLRVEYEFEEVETVVLSLEMGPEVMEMEQAMTFEGEASFSVDMEIAHE